MPYYYIVRDENNNIVGSRKSKNRVYNWAIIGWTKDGYGGVWGYRAEKEAADKESSKLMNSYNGQIKELKCRVVPVESVTAEEYKAL